MPDISSIVQIIQLMLAPGLMISACGLLLLGMNNKYSLIVNRIRLLNEERRKELVKLVRKFGEESRVAIRNVRRDAIDHLKREEKEKKMTEDQLHDAEKEMQKLTDDHIKLVDDTLKHKEKEIMEV